MVVLVVIDVLVGAGFGLFFPVFALFPSTFAAIGTAGLLGLSLHTSIWSTVCAMCLAGGGLQVGYLAGAICRVLNSDASDAIWSSRPRRRWRESSSRRSANKQLRSPTRM